MPPAQQHLCGTSRSTQLSIMLGWGLWQLLEAGMRRALRSTCRELRDAADTLIDTLRLPLGAAICSRPEAAHAMAAFHSQRHAAHTLRVCCDATQDELSACQYMAEYCGALSGSLPVTQCNIDVDDGCTLHAAALQGLLLAMPQLEVVMIWDKHAAAEVASETLGLLAHCHELRVLWLNYSSITEQHDPAQGSLPSPMEQLACLPQLEVLFLCARLHCQDLRPLASLTQLETLGVWSGPAQHPQAVCGGACHHQGPGPRGVELGALAMLPGLRRMDGLSVYALEDDFLLTASDALEQLHAAAQRIEGATQQWALYLELRAMQFFAPAARARLQRWLACDYTQQLSSVVLHLDATLARPNIPHLEQLVAAAPNLTWLRLEAGELGNPDCMHCLGPLKHATRLKELQVVAWDEDNHASGSVLALLVLFLAMPCGEGARGASLALVRVVAEDWWAGAAEQASAILAAAGCGVECIAALGDYEDPTHGCVM